MASKVPDRGSESQYADMALDRHAGPAYRLLDSLTERYQPKEGVDGLRTRLRNACAHFPHIAHRTVTVGCRVDPGADHSRWTPYASAEPVNHLIRLPVESSPSNQTLFHELAHVEIYERVEKGHDLPETSEEFCSIYAVARMPPGLIYRDDIAYLGEPSVPKDEWPENCRLALDYREERGANSHYIQRAKEWLGI